MSSLVYVVGGKQPAERGYLLVVSIFLMSILGSAASKQTMNIPSTGSNASAIVSNPVELFTKNKQPSERFQKPSPNASENSHLQLMLGIAIPCRVETGLTIPQGCEQACSNLRSPAEVMQKRTGVTTRMTSSCTWSKSYKDADWSSRPPFIGASLC